MRISGPPIATCFSISYPGPTELIRSQERALTPRDNYFGISEAGGEIPSISSFMSGLVKIMKKER